MAFPSWCPMLLEWGAAALRAPRVRVPSPPPDSSLDSVSRPTSALVELTRRRIANTEIALASPRGSSLGAAGVIDLMAYEFDLQPTFRRYSRDRRDRTLPARRSKILAISRFEPRRGDRALSVFLESSWGVHEHNVFSNRADEIGRRRGKGG